MRKTKTPTIIYGMGEGEAAFQEQLAKSVVDIRTGKDDEKPSLTKSILNILDGGENNISRLAFETDPRQFNNFAGVYHAKLKLIPDTILKRIAIQDSLVASIVRARQNHLTSFGRPRPDRFSSGFIIKPNTGTLDKLDAEGKKKFAEQVERAIKLISTCGHTEGQPDEYQKTFSEYLGLSVRSAVVCGRIATEIVYAQDDGSDTKRFHHFACTDAGTIYKATTDKTGQESIRKEAYHLLCKLTGEKLVAERWNENGKYSWVQVIEGTPEQVFTADEMRVYNFYPVPDVELDGYPVTPIDTVITAITTHINITTHNKLYFQSGRATRGMLILKSDDASPAMIHQIKQQFNASINGAPSAWRMPVFGVPTDGEITWQPIDSGGGRDAEFQYLTDMNAREIMTAFMMGPDELPGWSYLSRGTASQALSESNSEYKMEAGRDVGIRPLLASFEDFINAELLPLIDLDLSKKARISLLGLEAQTEEKESTQLQTSAEVYLTFDDILQKVEKSPVGKEWGGQIPLNPVFKTYLDTYRTVGEIREHFMGIKDASKDPNWAFPQNPMWFQNQQLMQAAQQAQAQAQQAQQGGGQPGGGGGGQPGGGEGAQDASQGGQGQDQPTRENPQDDQTENQRSAQPEKSQPAPQATQLGKAIEQAFDLMSKSETNLPPEKRKILEQHRKTVEFFTRGFKADVKDGVREILDIATQLSPRKK
jgi:hypothetical protein